MAVTLGHNQYGKAEVHLVRVTRHDDTNHDIKDVNVTTQLYGDFEQCHRTGANENLSREFMELFALGHGDDR